MKHLTAILCLTLTLLLGSVGNSESADYNKGLAAAKSGDFATALREWTPLAKQGDAFAQYNLGQMYRQGKGVPQNYKTAVKWYKLAAEQENARAQYNLGLLYFNGKGVPKDNKIAVKWFRLAADQGDADAQNNLGFMYGNGQGLPQDYIRAHMWWNLAASSGNKEAVPGRDAVSKHMTPAQIADAQKLARECVRKKYKGC
jgi:TPR repeat protein